MAINQFRIVTPGGPREGIIPDIVLFVNGLPFSVIECKDVDVTDPISESINQIMRYANTREDDFGIKEGEERLFHYNLFSIATHGEEARFGTITGDFEYYLNWKDIFPEMYKTFDINSYSEEEEVRYGANGLHKEPGVRQEVAIQGLLNKEILLDVLRHFTLFMEIKEGVEVKVVCRYQQFRAVGKILERLRNESSGKNKIWSCMAYARIGKVINYGLFRSKTPFSERLEGLQSYNDGRPNRFRRPAFCHSSINR